jgi:hypothetical protein
MVDMLSRWERRVLADPDNIRLWYEYINVLARHGKKEFVAVPMVRGDIIREYQEYTGQRWEHLAVEFAVKHKDPDDEVLEICQRCQGYGLIGEPAFAPWDAGPDPCDECQPDWVIEVIEEKIGPSAEITEEWDIGKDIGYIGQFLILREKDAKEFLESLENIDEHFVNNFARLTARADRMAEEIDAYNGGPEEYAEWVNANVDPEDYQITDPESQYPFEAPIDYFYLDEDGEFDYDNYLNDIVVRDIEATVKREARRYCLFVVRRDGVSECNL